MKKYISVLMNLTYYKKRSLIVSNLFRDNGFGGCEETMVTNNCDQYAYSDTCSDA